MSDFPWKTYFWSILTVVAIGAVIANPRSWWGGVSLLGLAIAAYFLPSIVAGNRKHNNGGAILMLNLLLGWTLLGWIIALVWSLTDNINKNGISIEN